MKMRLFIFSVLVIGIAFIANASDNVDSRLFKIDSNIASESGNYEELEEGQKIIKSNDGLFYYRVKTQSQNDQNNNDGVILDVPANDDCMNATEISGFFEYLAWDNREATLDGPEECLTEPNVWFLYTATITGEILISTDDPEWDTETAIDTRIGIYDGSVCPVAEADPEIQEMPGGETIETAVAITGMLPVAYSGTTEGYDHDYDLNCVYDDGENPPDVVYSYTSTFDGRVTFSLCGSQEDFNTALALYDSDGFELACADDNGCDDSHEVHSKIISYPVTNGETYYIVVSGGYVYPGFFGNSGEYVLTLSSPDYYLIDCNQDYATIYSQIILDVEEDHQYLIEVGGESSRPTGCGVLSIYQVPEPPSNDDCENAMDIGVITSGTPIQVTGPLNLGATIDCPQISEVPEVWVKFTLEETMDIDLNFCYSDGWPDYEFCFWYMYLTESCPCGDAIVCDASDFIDCGNYGDMRCLWENLPPGTYLYPIASYINNPDYFVINITGAADQVCSDDALFGQSPSGGDDYMYFYASEVAVGAACADRFTSVDDTVNQVSWWGAMIDGDLEYCESDPHPFQIIFCENNLLQPSVPGDTLATYNVSVSPVLTGVSFESYDEIKCIANLTPPVVVPNSGWIIIRGESDDDCYFFWQDAGTGESVQYIDDNSTWTTLSYDLAFCLSYDSTQVGIEDTQDYHIPEHFMLTQNYPNPFNAETSIQLALQAASEVTLAIFDVNGRLVKTVYDGNLPAGNHSVIWNGTTDSGEQVSSGIYFYRLQSEQGTASKSMVLLK